MVDERQVSIKIWESTKRLLDRVKHEGQSYDGIIRELIRDRETTDDLKKKLREHEERIRTLETRREIK
jgi:hypothetical protein